MTEGFRRLARAPHRLDPPLRAPDGLAATPAGGVADLRSTREAALAGSPFDGLHYTPDLRRPRGRDGRHGISRLSLHLYRLRAFRVADSTPAPVAVPGATAFTFDPSGRDVPLFAPRSRGHAPPPGGGAPDDWSRWRPAEPWELPAPIPCHLLGHAVYRITEPDVLALEADPGLPAGLATQLRQLRGRLLPSEARLRLALSSRPDGPALLADPIYRPLAAQTLQADCGKSRLFGPALQIAVDQLPLAPPEWMSAGDLATWRGGGAAHRLVIDPERGRFLYGAELPEGALTVTYHQGLAAPLGAGPYDRRSAEAGTADATVAGGGAIPAAALPDTGLVEIADSATYTALPDIGGVAALTIRAANQRRPYLRIDGDWIVDSGTNGNAELTLDGLWIGTTAPAALILRGDWQRVTLRHVTLDPGGPLNEDPGSTVLPPLRLVVEGRVQMLEVANSILGPVALAPGAAPGDPPIGHVDSLSLTDSLAQAPDESLPAIDLPDAEVLLRRTTVMGGLTAKLVDASDTLITGPTIATNPQDGCFRFSAAPAGSPLPHPYRAVWLDGTEPLFVSRRFGSPWYGRLSRAAPTTLTGGSEAGAELGAYSALSEPVRTAGLRAKVDEYMPFGLLPIFVFET